MRLILIIFGDINFPVSKTLYTQRASDADIGGHIKTIHIPIVESVNVITLFSQRYLDALNIQYKF